MPKNRYLSMLIPIRKQQSKMEKKYLKFKLNELRSVSGEFARFMDNNTTRTRQ